MAKKTEKQKPGVVMSYKGKDFYIQAESFDAAAKWLDYQLMKTKGNLDEILPVMSDENEPELIKAIPVEGQMQTTTDGLRNKLMKGYDYETGSYIMTVVDVTYQQETTVASKEGNDRKVQLQKERLVCGCNEEQRMFIDGTIVPIRNEEDLTKKLKKQFPDGIRVLLAEESLARLMQFKDTARSEVAVKLMGMIDAEEGTKMARAYGTLKAELVLKPEDYHQLYACDDTYYTSELSEMGFDAGVNATSMMLAIEKNMKEARIETFVCEELLNSLVIEDMPYHELMKMVQKHNIQDEGQLHHLLNMKILAQHPQWKLDLAKQQTREVTQKFFVEKAAPAFMEQKKMYHETEEMAAKENGYANAAEWNRDTGWTKNPSPELEAKLKRTMNRWSELYRPYETKANKVFQELEELKSNEARKFIERFDRKANEVISDVKVTQRINGKWYLNCKIDGVQQLGQEIKTNVVNEIQKSNHKNTFIKELAQQLYKNEVVHAMDHNNDRGLSR